MRSGCFRVFVGCCSRDFIERSAVIRTAGHFAGNDALGRVILKTAPNNAQTSTAYHGLSVTVTDANNQSTTTVRNAQGLIASVTHALSHTTSYVCDASGELVSTTDPAGHVVSNVFDIRGRKTSSSDPDMGAWSYGYDGFDELVSQTDARNQTTSLSYDALGRRIQSSDPTQTARFTYGTSVVDHNIGQLASASTNGGYKLSNSFDAYGRSVGATLTIAGTNYPYAAPERRRHLRPLGRGACQT